MLDGLFDPTDARLEAAPVPRRAQPPATTRAGGNEVDGRVGGDRPSTPVASGPAVGAGPLVTPRVIGLDLSLTATGIAGHGWTDTLKPPAGHRGVQRLHWLRDRIFEHTHRAALVVVEGPSYGSQGGGHHELAGLWWLTAWTLHRADVPMAVVPPASLKKYATGKGNATKADMRVALLQRAGIDERDDNQVDAWWLHAIGVDHLGRPAVTLPAAHRQALAKVAWPEGITP